ncbi:MAG: hypothetical protein HZC55_23470 [Verrucomicrobia bacterium]|nr:hypothetical protein [Verrucomicrobiota bacterium]
MRRLPVLLLLVLSLAVQPAVQAQAERNSREFALATVTQAMIAALEAGNFGRARHLCEQLILWEPDNPVHHYNLACVEAKAGGTRRQQAFPALEQAVKLGFNDAKHLSEDPDLESLRSDPRFAELVRRTAGNASASRAVESLAIPNRAPEAVIRATSGAPGGTPSGLFLGTPPSASAPAAAPQAWFFSPDGRVFQSPREGVDATDLSSALGLKGYARPTNQGLEIAWSNGTVITAPLLPVGEGFSWNGTRFQPASPVTTPTALVGTFVEPLAKDGDPSDRPREVTLQADGSARWTDAFRRTLSGRWDLRGFSLRLIEADGTVQRLLAVPLGPTASATPTRLLLGAGVFERKP